MNEFNALRVRAREKRDRLIAQAHKEYNATLAGIAKIELELVGRTLPKRLRITTCIENVMPRDREFTTADIMAGLQALDPNRLWGVRPIARHLRKLSGLGIVTLISGGQRGHRPVYAMAGVSQAAELPACERNLADVIREVLTRPMNSMEIAVAVMETGYRSTMDHSGFRKYVERQLRRMGFGQAGGKWVPAG